MSTRGDATYDLIMLALGAVDELWSRVFDSVKAWAGEETGDLLEEWIPVIDELVKRTSGQVVEIKHCLVRINALETRLGKFEDRLAYLEDDAGPRPSECDGVKIAGGGT